jgi:hypothetical protein
MSEAKLAQILMIFITVLYVSFFRCEPVKARKCCDVASCYYLAFWLMLVLFITKSDCGKVLYVFMLAWSSLSELGSVGYDTSIRLITRLLC